MHFSSKSSTLRQWEFACCTFNMREVCVTESTAGAKSLWGHLPAMHGDDLAQLCYWARFRAATEYGSVATFAGCQGSMALSKLCWHWRHCGENLRQGGGVSSRPCHWQVFRRSHVCLSFDYSAMKYLDYNLNYCIFTCVDFP